MIKIQDDYWIGDKCVENEVPWQTPSSIHYLDALLKPTDQVVEIGTGGSTLFFARRCKSVLAIETNYDWYLKMQAILTEKNITNVTYTYLKDQAQIEEHLKSWDFFDVASVDSVHGYNRSAFLNIVLEKNKNLSTLVLDNYGDRVLFPWHHNWAMHQIIAACPGDGWDGQDFNDSHWVGNGTRILRRYL